MYTEQLQALIEPERPQEQELRRRREGVLTELTLRNENLLYARTRGVSRNNRSVGYVPAYLNSATGESAESRFADGTPAPIHLLDGLPDTWIQERDADGHVVCTCPGIVAGFLRNGCFFTREEAARAAAH